MFLLSSSRFRQATKNRILLRLRLNDIVPAQTHDVGIRTLDKRTINQ
jgi:hypothetical protein